MGTEKSRPYIARWRDAVLSADGPAQTSTRALLMALAKYADPDGGSCYPSVTTLASSTALSKRSVISHLSLAVDGGWLSKASRRTKDGWKHNYYRLVLPEPLGADSALGDEPSADIAPRGGGVGANSAPAQVQPLQLGGATVAPDLATNLANDQEGRAHRAGSPKGKPRKDRILERPEGLPEGVTADTWAAYARHRKKIGKPLTDEAVRRLVPKLCRMADDGHDPEQALDNSIVNGWTGVFAPKAGEATGAPSQRRASPSDHAIGGWD